MADKKGEEPGKSKAEKEETQPSHSKDTQEEVKDPVEGLQVDDPEDLTDPSSEDEDLSLDWDHVDRHRWARSRYRKEEHNPEGWKFRTAGHKPEGQFDYKAELLELRDGAETDEFKLAEIRSQEIPSDIKRQRRLLQNFYTAWKKQKFGPSEKSEDEEDEKDEKSGTGLTECKRLPSIVDHVTSACSILSNAFLLFANAYPKHAASCYKMAECSFKMATLASQVLSALWKLNHGFTLSSMETAIKQLEFPLIVLLLKFINAPWSLQHMYSVFVNHVTSKKAFERDEEFQIGYEQPPIEAQILAFTSAVDVNSVKLREVIVQIKKLVEPPTDLLKPEEGPGQRMEEGKYDGPNTLSDLLAHISDFHKSLSTIYGHINNYKIQDS